MNGRTQRCGRIAAELPSPVHFVTGRLAAQPLRRHVEQLAARADFAYSIQVLPISVAALMTPEWIARHIRLPEPSRSVLVPGYCQGDLTPIEQVVGVPVRRGPRDLRHLPQFFGQQQPDRLDYGAYAIEILAEINHAPRLSRAEIVAQAKALSADGADVIDLGCEPGSCWRDVGDCVRHLRDEGLRVSIDSFNPTEVAHAVRAGAELVLSVNSMNVHAAVDWGCEVVAIPDQVSTLAGLDKTIEVLTNAGVPFRIDPILEPIGLGFAASLQRYIQVRAQFPNQAILMGIGNLTEMTDADSAAINVLLLGICAELNIGSVLTTQVIPWAQTSVRECDLARRLVHYAVRNRVPAKRIEPRLVVLRDDRLEPFGQDQLHAVADNIKDANIRLFAECGRIHALNAELFLASDDPFDLFRQIVEHSSREIDARHAFYLGYEMAKAELALMLGKQYQQDEPLDWGFLSSLPRRRRRDSGESHG